MKKAVWLSLTLLVVLLVGCQKNSADNNVLIDWVDFVKFNGISYLAEPYDQNSTNGLTKEDLGKEHGKIKFKVADNIQDSSYQSKNGDAAFIEPGTPIYEVLGYSPTFRLALLKDDKVIIYEAFTNPQAKVGSDLLDLKDKVTYIGINSEEDGTTELASIKEDAIVQAMVDITLKAPVDQKAQLTDGTRYFIEFHLKDGTSVKRAYWVDSGQMSSGIMLPEEFGSQVQKGLIAKE